MLFKVDLYTFTDFDKLNTYLVNKFNIPAFQHRIIHRLSVFSFKMLNFVSAPKNLKEVFLKSLEEKSLTEKSVSVDLVGAQIEPVFIPENTRTLRNGKTFLSKPEIVTKYYLKTFDHFSKSFLNCFKLDIFEERLGKFNTWLNNNMTYVFRSFTENFSNFNLALNNLYMYKSDKKT